jgi:Fe-S cluster assembly protein SufD
MMLRGQSHGDFTLVVDHAAPACESRELVKAVLDGRSRGVFQGKVIVQRGAQQTDGKQMANALLLSDEAEFDSKPELEIYADDVACGHGATAGQLDDELMFYLRARGIPEPQAKALLISAFIGEALSKIENEALREALQEKVDAWLS